MTKICVPTAGRGGREDAVGEHFGRVPSYTIFDTETQQVNVVDNTSEHAGGSGLPARHPVCARGRRAALQRRRSTRLLASSVRMGSRSALDSMGPQGKRLMHGSQGSSRAPQAQMRANNTPSTTRRKAEQ